MAGIPLELIEHQRKRSAESRPVPRGQQGVMLHVTYMGFGFRNGCRTLVILFASCATTPICYLHLSITSGPGRQAAPSLSFLSTQVLSMIPVPWPICPASLNAFLDASSKQMTPFPAGYGRAIGSEAVSDTPLVRVITFKFAVLVTGLERRRLSDRLRMGNPSPPQNTYTLSYRQ